MMERGGVADRIRIITYLASLTILLCALYAPTLHAQQNLSEIVQTMVKAEQESFLHEPQYIYTSIETSERTSGHEWTERVADLSRGKLRYLLAEDGHALSSERRVQEIGRIKTIAANPESFFKHEQLLVNDEEHAQRMLYVLSRGFQFDDGGTDGPWRKINYKPNPAYSPRTYEERALCGMSGSMLVETGVNRLHRVDGKLLDDVTFGWGILGTVHRGSSFSTTREMIAPNMWKTTTVDTNIDGRVALLKTVGSHQHAIHKDFLELAKDVSVSQAADLLTK